MENRCFSDFNIIGNAVLYKVCTDILYENFRVIFKHVLHCLLEEILSEQAQNEK